MTAKKTAATPDLLARYECNGFRFPDRDYYDRHVVFDHVVGLSLLSASRYSRSLRKDLGNQRG